MDFIFLQTSQGIDWKMLLYGEEDVAFLIEVALRSTLTYLVTLLTLRLLGKRGISQLSVFELVIILTLGSAAGDAMFYKDVGLLQSFMVFGMVAVLYRVSTYLMGKNEKFEKLVEGKEEYIIKDGRFDLGSFKTEIAYDEFFAQLRQRNVSHLGQVERGILEINGKVSLFYFEDDNVKYGLPILPEDYEKKISDIKIQDHYSCAYCGNTEELGSGAYTCKICNHNEWIKSKNNRRIT